MPNEIVIGGGGIAGVSAALKLANKGHKVKLIEKLPDLLGGSSNNTPARLGLGFHYIDHNTAIKYLLSSIKVLREYPDFVLGGTNLFLVSLPDKNKDKDKYEDEKPEDQYKGIFQSDRSHIYLYKKEGKFFFKFDNTIYPLKDTDVPQKLKTASFNNTPCDDPDIRIPVLKAIIQQGHKLLGLDPAQRGRYFVVENSQFEAHQVMLLHDTLKKEYARLIEIDPKNKVLGEPKFFSQILTFDKFPSEVNASCVVAALETAEKTLDWPRLKEHLIKQVTNHPNIEILTDTEILNFKLADDNSYEVTVKTAKKFAEEKQPLNQSTESVTKGYNIRLISSRPTEDQENTIAKNDLCLYLEGDRIFYATKTNQDIIKGEITKEKYKEHFDYLLSVLQKTLSEKEKINDQAKTALLDITSKRGHTQSAAKEEKSEKLVRTIPTQIFINSTWQEIEKLNKTAGFLMAPESRTIRTKVMIEIQLPDTFRANKELSHAMFFCFGPHAAFTPLKDGRGYITFEPYTNVKDKDGVEQQTTDYEISEFSQRLVDGKATEKEKELFCKKIIEGASYYIPVLKDAEYKSVRFGLVRTDGTVKLDDPKSDHHKRDNDGIESIATRVIKNPSMKLLYFLAGSEKILELVEQHLLAINTIPAAVSASEAVRAADRRLFHVVHQALERSILPEKLFEKRNPNQEHQSAATSLTRQEIGVITDKLAEAIDHKAALLKELTQFMQEKTSPRLKPTQYVAPHRPEIKSDSNRTSSTINSPQIIIVRPSSSPKKIPVSTLNYHLPEGKSPERELTYCANGQNAHDRYEPSLDNSSYEKRQERGTPSHSKSPPLHPRTSPDQSYDLPRFPGKTGTEKTSTSPHKDKTRNLGRTPTDSTYPVANKGKSPERESAMHCINRQNAPHHRYEASSSKDNSNDKRRQERRTPSHSETPPPGTTSTGKTSNSPHKDKKRNSGRTYTDFTYARPNNNLFFVPPAQVQELPSLSSFSTRSNSAPSAAAALPQSRQKPFQTGEKTQDLGQSPLPNTTPVFVR
ncbi:MAG TPA: FAD-dependent oxidoreductase [Gammaproteobacteria bacterium]|nr:FAD-dependent oxidoreductase [Gammaproteobacteria bacterium]